MIDTSYDNHVSSPAVITRHEFVNVGSAPFKLGTYKVQTFKTGPDFKIWPVAVGGTELVQGVDYELLYVNRKIQNELGTGVTYEARSWVRMINPTYQTGSVWIDCKIFSTELGADWQNHIDSEVSDLIAEDVLLHAEDVNLQAQISALGAPPITVIKTASYTILDNDNVGRIESDTTSAGAAITMTLPLIANNIGREITIARVLGSVHSVFVVPNATDTNTISYDGLASIELSKQGDYIKLKHSAASGMWEIVDKKITCFIRLNTHAGYGSTDTAIARFTNLEDFYGDLITENHVSGYNGNTEGLEITILKSGIYSAFASRQSGATYMGLTLNSAELTTSIISITSLTSRLAMGGLTGGALTIGCTRFFSAGDIIRPHNDKSGAAGTSTKFELEYIG